MWAALHSVNVICESQVFVLWIQLRFLQTSLSRVLLAFLRRRLSDVDKVLCAVMDSVSSRLAMHVVAFQERGLDCNLVFALRTTTSAFKDLPLCDQQIENELGRGKGPCECFFVYLDGLRHKIEVEGGHQECDECQVAEEVDDLQDPFTRHSQDVPSLGDPAYSPDLCSEPDIGSDYGGLGEAVGLEDFEQMEGGVQGEHERDPFKRPFQDVQTADDPAYSPHSLSGDESSSDYGELSLKWKLHVERRKRRRLETEVRILKLRLCELEKCQRRALCFQRMMRGECSSAWMLPILAHV